MISIDTLRADHLSAYGNTRIRTPKIDAFAANGTLFSSAGKVLGGANRNRYAVRESRDGAFVLRAATEWLAGRREEPFFAFVHLFDLHQPYRVAGGYDGELQYRLYEKALAEAYDGRTNAAIVRLRSILERDPHNTLAQRDLGECKDSCRTLARNSKRPARSLPRPPSAVRSYRSCDPP